MSLDVHFFASEITQIVREIGRRRGLAGERTERRRQAVVKSKMIRKMVGKFDGNSREIV